MKLIIPPVASALVETVASHPDCDCRRLCDVALHRLACEGCSPSDLRLFLRAVARELRAQAITHGELRTPSGKSGNHRETLATALHHTLGRRVLLEEHAEPSLLGGATISIEDEYLDRSLHGALHRLASYLTAP
jgi:hypothetical protein